MNAPIEPPSPSDLQMVREVAGLALLLLGMGGLVTCAFLVHPVLGVAAVSVLLGAAGIFLATGRE